jgi:glutamyl-tRNA reductase
MKLVAAGISHKTAPVELREQLAVQPPELPICASTLKLCGVLDEIVLLSTCNRVEIYTVTERPTTDIKSLIQLLSSEPRKLDDQIYVHEDAAAVRHLLRVTAGLDSMVLGETEITGQIKNAYEIARAAGFTGRVLNRLFQRAFQTAKEIRTRTGIGCGTVSIKSAALDLVRRISEEEVSHRSIMVIGAGQMAESCIRFLIKKGASSMLISNRSFDRAFDLAIRYGAKAVCFGDCLFGMRDMDVVIAATGSPETLLNRADVENVMKARGQRPLLLIDLSVPRNIDSAVVSLDNVSLYNIDGLEALARERLRNRERELGACHQIIEAHVTALIEKLRAESERHYLSDRSCRSSRPHHFAVESGPLLQAT